TVLEASNGEEALKIAERHEGPLDLLLSDVVMPRMGGPELAQELLARRPAEKVLYMSGYTDHPMVRRGVVNAGVAFLQKPFTPPVLVSRIREILKSSQAWFLRWGPTFVGPFVGRTKVRPCCGNVHS